MQLHTEQTLTQLAETFRVRDIMIDVAELVRADNQVEAEQLLDQNPEYDHIPMPAHGPIGGYFARSGHKLLQLRHSDLISDGTSLLVLPELLIDRDFFFVLASNKIQGFVHFSDLNNSRVKLPLFVLFEAIEQRYVRRLSDERPTDDVVCSVLKLSADREKELRSKVARASAQRANRSLLDYIYFDELLRLCEHYDLIQIKGESRQDLSEFRNRVAHSSRPLVEEHKDVRRLVRVRDEARRLLA